MYAKRVSEIRIATDLARLARIEQNDPTTIFQPEQYYNQSIKTIQTANQLSYLVRTRAWRTRGGKTHEKVRRG